MSELLSDSLATRGAIRWRCVERAASDTSSSGLFAWCRCSTGPRGGFMACSFRHPRRQDRITAVQAWAAANARFKAKPAAHWKEDLQAFRCSG